VRLCLPQKLGVYFSKPLSSRASSSEYLAPRHYEHRVFGCQLERVTLGQRSDRDEISLERALPNRANASLLTITIEHDITWTYRLDINPFFAR
jgi:hypothetical protein